ncbi:MAG: GerMN domain-containing protein [Actinomycetota bacterium]
MRRIPLLAVLVLAVLLPACEDEGDTSPDDDEPDAAELDDTVALTLYHRTGSSSEALLEPVTEVVEIGEDLPHRAVELLLDGPDDDELEAAWPEGTEVNGVHVEDGRAHVDLSDAALEDPPSPDRAAHLEALALASLANTLTEFQAIDEVVLTIDGEGPDSEAVGDFWGGWGMPESLTRDPTLIADEDEDRGPELELFEEGSQVAGSEEAEPVVVRSVRARDRITYVRLVVEIADASDPEESPEEVPRAFARTGQGDVVLEVHGVEGLEDAAVPEDLDETLAPVFLRVEVDDEVDAGRLRITMDGEAAQDPWAIHLHTATSPSRVVLDVRK